MSTQRPPWLSINAPQEGASPFAGLKLDEPRELRFVTGERAMGWLAHHLQSHVETTLWVDLDGTRTVSDAILLTGEALDISSPGSAAFVAATLATGSIQHVVWDGRNVSPDVIHAAHANLTTMASGIQCWTASDRTVAFSTAIPTPPCKRPIPGDIPEDLEPSVWLSGSVRARARMGTDFQRPDAAPGRLRIDVLRALQQQPRRSIAAVADQVIHHHHDLFALATGSSLAEVRPADLFGLRLIAEYASDENVACLAAASAAIIRARFGQPADALERIDQGLARTNFADPAHRALLVWAEARIHLSLGDTPSAEARFVDATNLVHAGRDLGLLATMHRRWADALSSRGAHDRSADHYRSARALYRQRAHTEGLSAALRGSADQAVATGEFMSAEALYDQAEMHTTTDVEQANRLVGWASLAIAQGAWERARSLLDRATRTGADDAWVRTNCIRRRADLALRAGDPITAATAAKEAQQRFAQTGCSAAAARCQRLAGDAAAMQGAFREAMTAYHQALQAQIRAGDWNGLDRTIQHIVGLLLSEGQEDTATTLQQIKDDIRGGVL
jgi:tetratricopeptide (TPR) repeat protein